MSKDNFYIGKCKSLIEEKLAWGSSAAWQNQDFETLREKIFETTHTQLSITTLKRLWGKVQYNSTPNGTTLNALAQFVGYDNWRAFTLNGMPPSVENVETASPSNALPNAPSVFGRAKSKTIWLGLCIITLAGATAFWTLNYKHKKLIFKDIYFSSKPVTLGLPNSVVFKYDASNSNADSVFIQQSWDTRLRHRVDKYQKEYVCTYYRPGYYRAKLILNDSVVKEHDVFIESQGWLGIIEKEPIPIYLPKKNIEYKGSISISEAELIRQGVDFAKEIPWVNLTLVDKNKTVPSNHFTMEVVLKNTYNKGDAVCQHTKVVLLGTDNAIVIPLSIKGCVGELELILANERIKGSTRDLSLFGVNFNDWIKVRYEVSNNHAKIFVNNQLAYQGQQKGMIGKVVGTRLQFRGAGAMKTFALYPP